MIRNRFNQFPKTRIELPKEDLEVNEVVKRAFIDNRLKQPISKEL